MSEKIIQTKNSKCEQDIQFNKTFFFDDFEMTLTCNELFLKIYILYII